MPLKLVGVTRPLDAFVQAENLLFGFGEVDLLGALVVVFFCYSSMGEGILPSGCLAQTPKL